MTSDLTNFNSWTGFVKTLPWLGAVSEAMQSVDRARFTRGEYGTAEVWTDNGLLIHRDDGTHLTSLTQPSLIGIMLELAFIAPGQRLLEVGSGTGYNAALMALLCGDAHRVVTVDCDPECVSLASDNLQSAGFGSISVLHADGCSIPPDFGQFDRIIVTGTTNEICESWLKRLRPGGICVAPLRVVPESKYSRLVVVRKSSGAAYANFARRGIVGFMSLTGKHQEATQRQPYFDESGSFDDLNRSMREHARGYSPSQFDAIEALHQCVVGCNEDTFYRTPLSPFRMDCSPAERLKALGELWRKLHFPRLEDFIITFGRQSPSPSMSYAHHCNRMHISFVWNTCFNGTPQ